MRAILLTLVVACSGCATTVLSGTIGKRPGRSATALETEVTGASVTLDAWGRLSPHVRVRCSDGRELTCAPRSNVLAPLAEGTPLPPTAFAFVAHVRRNGDPRYVVRDLGQRPPGAARPEDALVLELVSIDGDPVWSTAWEVSLLEDEPARYRLVVLREEAPGATPEVLWLLRDLGLAFLLPGALVLDVATAPIQVIALWTAPIQAIALWAMMRSGKLL